MKKPSIYQKKAAPQSGALLIEVLITMLVVALGLLGAAGMHLASVKYQQNASARNEALQQANFISEKMRANSSLFTVANAPAVAVNPSGGYVAPDSYDNADTLPADPNCGLNGQPVCTANQAAQRDLREWRQSLALYLPGGRGSLFPVNAAGGILESNARRVVIMWREKAQYETDTAANLGVDETDPSCPPPLVDGIRCLNLWVTP